MVSISRLIGTPNTWTPAAKILYRSSGRRVSVAPLDEEVGDVAEQSAGLALRQHLEPALAALDELRGQLACVVDAAGGLEPLDGRVDLRGRGVVAEELVESGKRRLEVLPQCEARGLLGDVADFLVERGY